MTRTELLAILHELDLQPSRKLGQNFLVDANMLEAIVRAAAPVDGEKVLEIGPGTGVLTARLLDAGCQVEAIEYDHRLANYLARRFADQPHFHLLQADACRVDIQSLMGDTPYRCIANLPYAVSTILLAKLVNQTHRPWQILVLLQKEMADRLGARPRSGQYGAATVQVQNGYAVDILRRLPPEVFFPPPEVASALVCLTAKPVPACPEIWRVRFVELVRLAFTQRRKTLVASLARRFDRSRLTAALAHLDIAPTARPEELTPEQFAALTIHLQ